jgi:phosphate acetyltransferase
VETVTPKLRSTVDAAALCKMAERGQITGGVLDGPLAFDNAISPVAAKTKEIVSAVAGQADILVVPDIESGNMVAKQLEYLADGQTAGVVLGARVPIVLTSRADDMQSRVASCAIALLAGIDRANPARVSKHLSRGGIWMRDRRANDGLSRARPLSHRPVVRATLRAAHPPA